MQTIDFIIHEIQNGPWQLVQLRGEHISTNNINSGDVDFLTNKRSVDLLLARARNWVVDNKCHFLIQSFDGAKYRLMFWSIDGHQRLEFDLWIRWSQLQNSKQSVTFADLKYLFPTDSTGVLRLPLEIEVMFYIHHLVHKNRPISSPIIQQILNNYYIKLSNAGNINISIDLKSIIDQNKIDNNFRFKFNAAEFNRIPNQKFNFFSFNKFLKGINYKILLYGLHYRAAFIVGSDGSGKTTLINGAVHLQPSKVANFKGKRLYRFSPIYKVLATILKPFFRSNPDKIDDILAAHNFFQSIISLEFVLLWRSKKIKLIDRSLIDFAIVGRKSNNPRSININWIYKYIGRRILLIHLYVPSEILLKRKNEMTYLGNDKYNNLIFNISNNNFPINYFLFNNSNSVETSLVAFNKIIQFLLK